MVTWIFFFLGVIWILPNSTLLGDCFHLAHGVASISFSFCPREANGLAHFFARTCYDSKTSYVWMDVLLNSYYLLYFMM